MYEKQLAPVQRWTAAQLAEVGAVRHPWILSNRRCFGMARAYGYGATMGAWVTDYLAYWAGHDGFVRHTKAAFRGPRLRATRPVSRAR